MKFVEQYFVSDCVNGLLEFDKDFQVEDAVVDGLDVAGMYFEKRARLMRKPYSFWTYSLILMAIIFSSAIPMVDKSEIGRHDSGFVSSFFS